MAAPNPTLIVLESQPPDALAATVAKLTQALPDRPLIVATPDGADSATQPGPNVTLVGYTPQATSNTYWILTAADFLNTHELAQKHNAAHILLLGAESHSLSAEALHHLAAALDQQTDLAVPRYDLPPQAGLVNSAILYPVTRALFAAPARFPLAIDLGLSARMAERLATQAQRFTAANQPDAIVWPVAEAAAASFRIAEVSAGPRALPQPVAPDLNALLSQVAASLFADVEAKAAFWQRARPAAASAVMPSPAPTAANPEEVQSLIETFRLAYGNLHEIWSLVLPPQSLLGLKRLSIAPPASFRMADPLWARVVYDFLLAYRLRTINRGHLLGALTPLYLAWVASHLLLTQAGTDPERHIEAVAEAFATDKPYLISRWRWPDRFNP